MAPLTFLKVCICWSFIAFLSGSVSAQSTCPTNVDFEEGLFSRWECFIGSVQAVGNQNVITLNPTAPVPPDPNRHLLIPRTTPSALDFYGDFPVNPPDGSNFAVKLGNTQIGAQAERIRYPINVPANAGQYFIVFQYAVVYEEPQNEPHRPEEHPRFTARLFDPLNNTADICANFDFNSSDPTGFQLSSKLSQRGDPVLFKPWQSVFINLTKYAGRTVYLEFTTADCTKTGHWGYAYVDVDDCDLNVKTQNSCLNNTSVLRGPSGFSNLKWWNSNFTTKYGEGSSLTISPALPNNTILKIELTPFSGASCKDTLTTVVTSPQFNINAGADKSICSGDSTKIGFTPKPNTSYQWTPSTSLSEPTQANPKAFPTSTTQFILIATDNETGCKAVDTLSVIIKPKPNLVINAPSICPGQTAQIYVSGAGTYAWKPDPSLSSLTGSSVSVSPAVSTTYSVTGIDTSTGCKNSINTNVTIFPKPNVIVNSPTVCKGTPAILQSSGANTYVWAPSAFLNISTGNTVNATPPDTLNFQVIGTNASGCKDTAIATVNILPLPDIRLNNAVICQGKEARLTATGGINYAWASLPNISIIAPDTAVVKPVQTTSYSVTGTNATNGCKKTVQNTVTVNPLPKLTLNTPAVCVGSNAVINASGANTYAWAPHPTLSTLTGSTVTVAPAVTTNYSVTGTNSATGCQNTAGTTVTIYPLPTGGISINGNNQFICDGYSVALVGSGGSNYQWYLNNSPISGATGNTLEAKQAGTYALELISPFGCKNFVTTKPVFDVLKKPIADFRSPGGCIGNTITFTNLSQSNQSGPVLYQWDLDDGAASTTFSPQHIYTNKGAYRPKLKVTSTICPQLKDSASNLIIVDAPQAGIRYPTVNTLINTNTPLTARNIGVNFLWQPAAGLNNTEIAKPIFNDDTENEYIIRITNAYGCVTYDSVKVRMFAVADIKVPKAFSPNGDGHNDRLDVFLIGIKELTFFNVFNRWGQLMFETNDRLQLWDGRFNGKEQPLETYVWIAQGIGIDGRTITKRGQTVLIR